MPSLQVKNLLEKTTLVPNDNRHANVILNLKRQMQAISVASDNGWENSVHVFWDRFEEDSSTQLGYKVTEWQIYLWWWRPAWHQVDWHRLMNITRLTLYLHYPGWVKYIFIRVPLCLQKYTWVTLLSWYTVMKQWVSIGYSSSSEWLS